MNTSFLVDIFLTISVVVFLTALYIIMPVLLLKKEMVLKQKPTQDEGRLLKKKSTNTLGNWFLKRLNKNIENNWRIVLY